MLTDRFRLSEGQAQAQKVNLWQTASQT